MRQRIVALLIALSAMSAAGTVLSACNTTEGMGKDISNAGHAISNEAEEHK
jgi:predicted small secreted protein